MSDWEIIIAYWGESERSETLANKCRLLQKKQLVVWGGDSSLTPGKRCSFYHHLSFQNVFPALNLPLNCHIMAIGSSTTYSA